jgi:hypothetical protein
VYTAASFDADPLANSQAATISTGFVPCIRTYHSSLRVLYSQFLWSNASRYSSRLLCRQLMCLYRHSPALVMVLWHAGALEPAAMLDGSYPAYYTARASRRADLPCASPIRLAETGIATSSPLLNTQRKPDKFSKRWTQLPRESRKFFLASALFGPTVVRVAVLFAPRTFLYMVMTIGLYASADVDA